MPTLRLTCDTGFVGAVHEEYMKVPDSEWNAMTAAEQSTYANDLAWEFGTQQIETGYELVEDGDE
jgi:hypothetical protein